MGQWMSEGQDGVRQDLPAAVGWYRRAAAQGGALLITPVVSFCA